MKHPADIAVEMVRDLIAEQVAGRVDRAEQAERDRMRREIREIMQQTGRDFADAFANWEAIQAFRRISPILDARLAIDDDEDES